MKQLLYIIKYFKKYKFPFSPLAINSPSIPLTTPFSSFPLSLSLLTKHLH